jgi:hypothetical protein
METSGGNNPVAFPPALMTERQAAADQQHRPIAEVVRELVEEGLEERHRRAHVEQERLHARERGLLDTGQPLTEEYRQTIHEKISQGLHSLREGKGTDGKTFFTELYSELEALDQQGR